MKRLWDPRALFRRALVAVPVVAAVVITVALSSTPEQALAVAEPTDELVNYETPHVYPLDLTPDGSRLVAVNTAAGRLEVFDVTSGTPDHVTSIPVGIDPVSVRARTDNEVWVVNHLSDSVSIVDLDRAVVTETIFTDNEPADVVFANGKAFVTASEANAVNVFDLADVTAAPQRISIKGEDPRALAVSQDGSTVYAAIFESGNGTTSLPGGLSRGLTDVVSHPEGPYQGATPPNDGDGFKPAINPEIGPVPMNALIVQESDDGRWMDDNGGDWSKFVDGPMAELSQRVPGWGLADNDVAVIDTSTLDVSYRDRLMNINMALAVNPATDDITVVGTDAKNVVRFEPNLNGTFLKVAIANLDRDPAGEETVKDLNPHLTYNSPSIPPTIRKLSIGDPRGIAWTADGHKAFITGMGSNNVVVSTAKGFRLGQIAVGEGPTGIVLDQAGRGYVLNKFSGSISTIDTRFLVEKSEVEFFDPTPQAIKDGRKFLYDTQLTSGLGHISCASCHVDARTDRLAWNLGDPSGSTVEVPGVGFDGQPSGENITISPMKGPMLTQTLQDIMDFPNLHWRGDRADLGEFNGAFVNLMGLPEQLPASQMDEFGDFLDTIHLPPNPYRNIDGTRPSVITLPNGRTIETESMNSLRGENVNELNCMNCHFRGAERPAEAAGASFLRQAIVPPSFAGWYDRLGYWPGSVDGSTTGFGFFHDGSVPVGFAARADDQESQDDMLAEIMTLEGPTSGLVGGERRQDSHAGVGQQVTVDGSASDAERARLDQLIAISDDSIFVALVAKSVTDGKPVGYQHLGNGEFRPDRASADNVTTDDLLAKAEAGEPVTFTLVNGGTEQRLGIDIDFDGVLDGDEDVVNPITGVISGFVTSSDGSGVGGVNVDLFSQRADGSRGDFLDSTTTGPDGGYQFTVAPGCSVLTFIAPDGQTFDGSRWFQPSVCVESGETKTVNALLDGDVSSETTIGGLVSTSTGSGLAGVQVDLFLAGGDGARGQYLGSATTGDLGRYSFAVEPGCHVLTFIAPDGETFAGSRWIQKSMCVDSGQSMSDVNAALDGVTEETSIGGLVSADGGSGVAGVQIDLFTQGANGDRASFLDFTTTGSDGRYSFSVDPGCYVLTMIAPSDTTFDGSRWFQPSVCVESGQSVDSVNAVLATNSQASLGGTVARSDGSPVADVKVLFYRAFSDGVQGPYLGEVATDSSGNFSFEVDSGCYSVLFVAPDGEKFTNFLPFLWQFRCVTDGEAVTDFDATIR